MLGVLTIISIGLVISYVIQQLLTFAEGLLLTTLGQKLSIEVILSYIHHIYELPLSFFATRRTGEITSRFTDATKIIDALANTIISLLLDSWFALTLAAVLIIQDRNLFYVTILVIPLYAFIIYAFIPSFEVYNKKTMQNSSMLNSSIIEDINGIETIKSLNAEKKSYQQVKREFYDYLKSSYSYAKLDIIQQALKMVIQLIFNVMVLWYGASLVIQNKLSLGQLMTYNALLSFFTSPIQNIINLQTKLQSARVASNRLNEIYLIESEFKKFRAIKEPMVLSGDIILNNVYYQYGFNKGVLSNVTFTIKKNSKVAIVGMSGSAKTTLVKILVGFYELDNGEITVNSIPINNIERHTLRSHINYLPQEPYIFNGTIRENLTLGDNDTLTNTEIEKACQIAEIQQDINEMPLGYETEIIENGKTLSGGQKQRLSIARSLLTSAEVLIFDESTSNLDTITEQKIVSNLLSLKNKTIIFVAHRLNIAEQVNNIVVLDHGKIVETGNHDTLMSKKKYYYRLYKHFRGTNTC